jgi:hypothetical protein
MTPRVSARTRCRWLAAASRENRFWASYYLNTIQIEVSVIKLIHMVRLHPPLALLGKFLSPFVYEYQVWPSFTHPETYEAN